jgi:hypothetical protein
MVDVSILVLVIEGGAGFSAAGFFSSAIYLHYTTNNM